MTKPKANNNKSKKKETEASIHSVQTDTKYEPYHGIAQQTKPSL